MDWRSSSSPSAEAIKASKNQGKQEQDLLRERAISWRMIIPRKILYEPLQGLFSSMSFWWLNPLMKKGRKKIIEDEDIPQLRQADQAQTCYLMYTEKMNKLKEKGSSNPPSMWSMIFSCHRKEILTSGVFCIDQAKCLESLSERQWNFRTRLIGVQVRSMLSAAIYQKQLRLSNDAKMNHSPGEIVNYVTIDAYKLGEFPYWFHQIWTTCLQLCLALFVVYYSVGLATAGALAAIILTVLASSPLAKLQHKYQTKLMEQQDTRLKAITEALANMKVLKLYAWETHFKKVIEEPVRLIPDVATMFIEAKVSLDRITKFLEEPELQNKHTRQKGNDPELDLSVFIRCAEISWDTDPSIKATLRRINLAVKPGSKGSYLWRSWIREINTFSCSSWRSSTSQWHSSCSWRSSLCFTDSMDSNWDYKGKYSLWIYKGSKSNIKRCLRDIYLLDDPFSAVDAHTATRLFNEYVMEALSEKTVLLVTHQVDFLPAFNSILLMSAGEILQAATYDELLASCQEFRELVDAHKDTVGSERSRGYASGKTTSGVSKEAIQKTRIREQQTEASGDQLIKKEEREIGDTGLKPYMQYLSHRKGFFVLLLDMIGLILAVFLLSRSFCLVRLSCDASDSISSTLLNSLFRAPMSFYDSTPLGRILSRVSSDLNTVDLDVAFKLAVSLGSTLNAYTSLGILAILTWPVLFLIIPMVYLCIVVQRYYFSTAKELIRISGTTKSSVVNHLAESIAGAMTIRAFGEEDRFFSHSLDLIDANASPYFHSFSANEWLIQCLEIPCAIVLSASALAMTLLPLGASTSGFVGMALSYGLSLNVFLIISVQYQCFRAESIISVERLEQYMHLPSEAPEIIESSRPPSNWPNVGKVEICSLKVRYQHNAPLVLRGISCIIEGGHKIGIVGRTGSGKTTLISTLFRLVEPMEGKIIIDGLDISTIGLHDLRAQVGIIPQDPTLFRGSVRYNLDPLSEHTDLQIWEVLEKCQLQEAIQQKDEGLNAKVAQDGSNWSMGQRQLFCLGRALLKRSRILVLDEATASIDNSTDAILQKTIRTEFSDCTVITVAHRIPTVMDCTKVLAITDGKLAEYDEPLNLMNKEGSLFGQLVMEYWSRSTNIGAS
ncbi:hypothetical protein OIU78_013703 [Salix suchowensis]|nr:hypothetical protein OIU78_013703 [Salix suchowensis]